MLVYTAGIVGGSLSELTHVRLGGGQPKFHTFGGEKGLALSSLIESVFFKLNTVHEIRHFQNVSH